MTALEMELEIEEVSRMIWSTVLDLPLDKDTGDVTPTSAAGVTGIVHVDGAWRGAVMLQCPLELATDVAAAMFRHTAAVSLEEIRDALGEVTNMIAGNLKPLLPQPSAISLPAVALGSDYEIDVIGARIVATTRFRCNEKPLVVHLLERADDARGDR